MYKLSSHNFFCFVLLKLAFYIKLSSYLKRNDSHNKYFHKKKEINEQGGET